MKGNWIYILRYSTHDMRIEDEQEKFWSQTYGERFPRKIVFIFFKDQIESHNFQRLKINLNKKKVGDGVLIVRIY